MLQKFSASATQRLNVGFTRGESKRSRRRADTIVFLRRSSTHFFTLPQNEILFHKDEPVRISARNQLIGRIVDIKIEGIMAQVTLSIAGQKVTSVITADAVREMRLQKGQVAAALIKSTEVMILRV